MGHLMKEYLFQEQVIKYLKSLGAKCWHLKVWGGGYQKAGVPDLLCCINGRFIAIELKREGGKASELQKRNIRKINEAGGVAIVLYPHQFEEFKNICEEILKNE